MRLDTARRFALSLPETTEEPHFDLSSFRVCKKIFATVPLDGKTLRLRVGAEEVRALTENDPAAFEVIHWGKRVVTDWVQIKLPAAEREHVQELLVEAWRLRAPKRVLAAFDAAAPA
jgi:hypothetical protein